VLHPRQDPQTLGADAPATPQRWRPPCTSVPGGCASRATRSLPGGYPEEDAEVWDSTGRLVAQSRQLARAPRS
jgi:hypothetical protein